MRKGVLLVVAVSAVFFALFIQGTDGAPYDPAVYMFARDNVDALRSFLASYAADADTGLYPAGDYDYGEMGGVLPGVDFPEDPRHLGWLQESFRYESPDGRSYTFTVRVNDGEKAWIRGTPEGRVEEYQHPMAGPGKYPKNLKRLAKGR